MTFWEFLAIGRRRWRAILLGLLLTVPFGAYALMVPGVYSMQVDVVFMNPHGPADANSFGWGGQSLISTAGVVARVVGGTDASQQPVSDRATLPGIGVRHGYSVRLPNIGGQWAYNFEQPLLDVEAVGSSPSEVQATMARTVERINDELTGLQRAQGVGPDEMIRTRLSPPNPQLRYNNGSRVRSFAAVLVIGLGLMISCVVVASRWPRMLRPRHGLMPAPRQRAGSGSPR